MKTFTEKLNFTDIEAEASINALKLDKRVSFVAANQLSFYCANNDINTNKIEDGDWDSACIAYEYFINSLRGNIFYFWIDKD